MSNKDQAWFMEQMAEEQNEDISLSQRPASAFAREARVKEQMRNEHEQTCETLQQARLQVRTARARIIELLSKNESTYATIARTLRILSGLDNRAGWRCGEGFRHTRKGEWDEVVNALAPVIRELTHTLEEMS